MTLTVKQDDYVKFAESKGLNETRIFFKYGVRNALLPQVTNLGLAISSIISGSVLIESFFNYPGLGGLLKTSVFSQDYFVVQGIVLMLILSVTVVLLIVEILNPRLDPTLRKCS
jgi:peptide/nickel transport system permease protein